MKQSRLKTKPRQRGTDQDAAFAWFLAVTRHKRCIVCGRKHPQMQAHHCVEQQSIRREFPHGAAMITGNWLPLDRGDVFDGIIQFDAPFRSLQDLLWDERNGVPVCPRDHERHTSHARLIPIKAIPAAAIRFASELGLQHRLGPRHYDWS